MNDQTIFWVWLQHVLGYGSNRITSVTDRYTFAEDFYRASLEDKLKCGCFKKSDIGKLSDLSLDNAAAIIERCGKCGIEIVTFGDVNYPMQLMNIASPPAALYVKGDVSVLTSKLAIAIVGTRSSTPYGRKAAFDFGFNLAKNGVTVVSGGAVGIDTCSHKGSLQAGGSTICVLGCGIEYDYLRENANLREVISKHGALVSEYTPDYPPSRYTFPQRNRLISGLTHGVLIVEAGERSGSLITANLALEQNRDVFAIPGSINSSVSFGTNKLIKLGAKPVTEVSDILEEYSYEKFITAEKPIPKEELSLFDFYEENKNSKNRKEKKDKKNNAAKYAEKTCTEETKLPVLSDEDFSGLSENAQKILSLFGKIKKDKIHIDTVTEKTGLPVSAVQAAITELEINDCIISVEGRMYKAAVQRTEEC